MIFSFTKPKYLYIMNTLPRESPVSAAAYGPVAQLGERCVRNAEVESSILFGSTKQILLELIFFSLVVSP